MDFSLDEVKGETGVAIKRHRHWGDRPICRQASIHVVVEGQKETMCGKEFGGWDWREMRIGIREVLSGECLGHGVCIPCHRLLASEMRWMVLHAPKGEAI